MKKNNLLLLAFVMITGTMVIQSCQTSSKTSSASKMLKFNFEKGKGYDYEMIMNMNQEMMGQTMKMDMSAYYSMDVKEDNGNEKTISITYDRFKIGMNMMGMNLDVDTDHPLPESGDDDPKKNPMKMVNRLFGAIRGQQFAMKVNAEGKVMEITGVKEMANSIIDSMGLNETNDPEMKEKMKEAFGKQFNDEDIKSQFERVLYIFPNKEVKVGDSWKKTTRGMAQMPGTFNSTYTVKEIEGDMVTLDEKSTITSAMKEEDVKMEMDGTVDGTIVVDSRSGLIVNADQKIKIKAKTQGMSFDIIAVSKVKGKAR